MKPGYYTGISNDEYHASEGVSRSTLDYLNISPGLVPWNRDCPKDDDAGAAGFGTAFHTFLLEPDRFDAEYVVAPECDRRTTVGKEKYAEFLTAAKDKNVLDAEEMKKLVLMRGSVMALPQARWLIEAPGDIEAAIYWIDPVTGELCKAKYDKHIREHCIPVDVKTVDSLERFQRAVEEHRYWFQDGQYSEGYWQHYGEEANMLFLVAQTTKELGRYPCAVYELLPQEKAEGRAEFRRLINIYHECRVTDTWNGVQSLSRPYWAKR